MLWNKSTRRHLRGSIKAQWAAVIVAIIAIPVPIVWQIISSAKTEPIPSACVPFFDKRSIKVEELYQTIGELAASALKSPRIIKSMTVNESYSRIDSGDEFPKNSIQYLVNCSQKLINSYDPPPLQKADLAVFAIYEMHNDEYIIETAKMYTEIANKSNPDNIYKEVEGLTYEYMKYFEEFDPAGLSDVKIIGHALAIQATHSILQNIAEEHGLGIAHSSIHRLLTEAINSVDSLCADGQIKAWEQDIELNLKTAAENSIPSYRSDTWEEMLARREHSKTRRDNCE